jgi:hypothetical protein
MAGVLVAVRVRDLRAWAAAWLLSVAMYTLACSALADSHWRRLLTSWWLDDPIRLAALVPVAAAPLAVIALHGAARWVAGHYSAPHRRRALLCGALGLVVVTIVSLQRADVREQRMRIDYAPAFVATAPPGTP